MIAQQGAGPAGYSQHPTQRSQVSERPSKIGLSTGGTSRLVAQVGPAGSGSGHCLYPQIQVPWMWTMRSSRKASEACALPYASTSSEGSNSVDNIASPQCPTGGPSQKAEVQEHLTKKAKKKPSPPTCSVSLVKDEPVLLPVWVILPMTRGPGSFVSPWNTKDITHPTQILRVTQLCQPSKTQKAIIIRPSLVSY